MRSTKKSGTDYLLDRIAESTFNLSRALKQAIESRMGEQRFNLLQFHALATLREHPEMTMSEFARHLHVTSPTATAFINRLVAQKWVKRRHDDKNRKLVRLAIAPAGERELSEKMRDHQRAFQQVLRHLTVTERRQLLSLQQKMLSRLAEEASS